MTTSSYIRIASIAPTLTPVTSWDDFASYLTHYVAAAAEQGAQIILFPEYITTPLACLHTSNNLTRALARYTPDIHTLFTNLCAHYQLTIIGGTHLETHANSYRNRCTVFSKGVKLGYQDKIHLTPWEREHLDISAGDNLTLFTIGALKACVLICYDSEFPELARIARAKGADILFVPSATDDAHGAARIRLCSAARAIENQVYVVISHILGTLAIDGMRHNVGNAAILTPCDHPFPEGGILSEFPANISGIAIADIDLHALHHSRTHGNVRTWQDQLPHLYPTL
jgi:predicted amidohydrolase